MFNNVIRRIKTAIQNPDLTIRLIRWLGSIAWPYRFTILIVLMIRFVSVVISYCSTLIGKYVIDDATSGRINARNMTLMCVTSAVSILIGIGSKIISDYINEQFTFSIRLKMFSNIQRSTWQSVMKYHSGDLLTRLTSDVGTICSGLINLIPSAITAGIQLLLAFGILYYYDHMIAIFALIMGPIGAFSGLIFRRKYMMYQQVLRESESQYRSFMQECLENITVMKTFQQEEINDAKNEQIRQQRLNLTLRSSRLSALMVALFRIIYNVSYMVAFCWGAYRISTGTITYGTMTIFITLVSQIQGTLSNLAGLAQDAFGMMISAKRIYDVTEMEKEITEESADKSVDKVVGKTADESADEAVDKSVGKNADKIVNKAVGKTSDKNADKFVDKAVGKSVDERVGKSVGKNADKVVNKAVGKSTDESAGRTGSHVSGRPASVGVVFSHVDFAYDKELILRDITLDIKPGSKVAIVGESGAGKTTFIRMLLALTKPRTGRVEFVLGSERAGATAGLDGAGANTVLDSAGETSGLKEAGEVANNEEALEVASYDKTLEVACPDSRRFISYVPQGNTLISGTIADNLRIGKADATEEEMWHALEMAGAARFMKKLESGLETTLSEKSGGISEGQAQRIAIARALISNKPFMILDEATSALDERTEKEILENIAQYYKDTTCIIITHRSSMLQYCDRTCFVREDGSIEDK